ncbi:MAG: HlyD family efflux transporter periplasmic adaptor subunit [Phycisphaerales bacterium]|nr:HlyD family efflux transporter periplasmic adaptor subunit [Phycisphaerales bacterium]
MDEQVVSISASTSTEVEGSGPLRPGHGVDAFLGDLIKRQCALVQAVAGVILLRPTREQPGGSTVRHEVDPRFAITPKQYRRLTEIAARAARENKPVLDQVAATTGLLSAEPEFRVLAAPLMLAGRPHGASLCIVPDRPEQELEEGLKRLELSTLAFEAFLWRQQAFVEAESKIQLREALDLIDKSNQGHDTAEMAAMFCNELQRRFGCLRVSIGLVHGHGVRVVAIGGAEHLDRRSEFAEALEALMEECADQDTEIRFPQPADADPSERRVVRAHASLSERFGPCAIASFPLRIEEGLIGVVVMERNASDPFNDATLRLLRLIAEYIGPMVWTRRMADRGVLAVSRDRVVDLSETLVGPQKTGIKMFLLAALLLLVISLAVPVRDRAVGTGRIIADERREISPPYSGRLDEVFVKPGDAVEAGVTPLFALDTREDRLELQATLGEIQRLRIQADAARTQGKTADAAQVDARRRVAEADAERLKYRVDQALIVAPISGVVTQGDLEDRLGEVVEASRPLIEIARLDTITAVALIPESGIARVEVGQRGTLIVTARPAEKINFRVTRITPASEVLQQKNVYRVEVELIEPPDWLRPGMEGQAKVWGRRTDLFTIYTRPLFDAIRLRFWW